MAARMKLIDQLAPVVRTGKWIDIGHDSRIKLSGRMILHRCNGRVSRHGLGWLVRDKPRLNWMLAQNSVDSMCQPA